MKTILKYLKMAWHELTRPMTDQEIEEEDARESGTIGWGD